MKLPALLNGPSANTFIQAAAAFAIEGSDIALQAMRHAAKPHQCAKWTVLLTHDQRAALAQAVEDGPTPAIDGVVRWRLVDLAQWVWDRFAVSISRQTLGRELRAMRYRKLSARPRHHAQAEGAVDAFKNASPTS